MLRECNRIVEYATSTSTRGIYFSPDCFLDDAVIHTIGDASFCQEQEQIDESLRTSNHNSLYHSLGSWSRREDARSPVELEFDENQKSLPQYTDGRSLRTIQCC